MKFVKRIFRIKSYKAIAIVFILFFVGCEMPTKPLTGKTKIKIDQTTIVKKAKRDTTGYAYRLRYVKGTFNEDGYLIYKVSK